MSPRLRLGLLAGFAAATFLAFPHPVAGRVVDGGLVFGWLAPALLVAGLRGLPTRRAGGVAFLAGLAAHTAVLHWIYVVTVTYGHAPPIAGVLAPAGLAAYIAAHTALFGLWAGWLGRRGADGPFALALGWTAIDWLRSFPLTGFPWATLGYAQHANPALVGLAAFGGVYALSFATALGGVGLAALARDRRSREAWAALAVVLVLHAAGGLARAPADPDTTVRVAVLQGNIDQGVKWSRDWYARTLEIYEGLTREAAAAGAEVVVWPETAVPGAVGDDPDQLERFARLAREAEVRLVMGAVGLDRGPDGRLRVYDSAFVIAPEAGLLERYDKSHLVPFGEYVPLADLLGRFFEAVARGIADTAVTEGSADHT